MEFGENGSAYFHQVEHNPSNKVLLPSSPLDFTPEELQIVFSRFLKKERKRERKEKIEVD